LIGFWLQWCRFSPTRTSTITTAIMAGRQDCARRNRGTRAPKNSGTSKTQTPPERVAGFFVVRVRLTRDPTGHEHGLFEA
jgi:hypothetical protein